MERNSDQATYTCVAKNQEGYSARGSLEVQVMGKSNSSVIAQSLSTRTALRQFTFWAGPLYSFNFTLQRWSFASLQSVNNPFPTDLSAATDRAL